MADESGEEPIDAFVLDQYGVNLSLTLVPRPPGMWTEGGNAQGSQQFGLSGVEKRGGLETFHGTALAGPVMAMTGVPLGSPFDVGITPRLIVSLREDTPLTGAYFLESTDGATWAAYTALTKPAMPWVIPFTRQESMYYVSELSGAVAMQRWNGTTRFQVIDAFPQVANGDVYGMWFSGGVCFFVVNADSPPAGADVYYVYSFRPESGIVLQMGAANLTHSVLGVPCALVSAAGELFMIGSGASLAAGVVYRLGTSGGTVQWVLDYGPLAREFIGGYITGTTSAAVHINGRLVVSLSGNGVTIPGEVHQRLNGSWSTIFTCPNNDESVRGFAVHGNVLLAALSNPSNAAVRIYADGVQELDVVSTFGATACVPGASIVFNGDLYWAWYRPGSVLLQGFVLKRTAAGSWSQATTGRALSGAIGAVGLY